MTEKEIQARLRLEARLDADLRELLLRPDARRIWTFLWDDPAWCGVNANVKEDTYAATERRLGRREIGLQMMAWAQRANPDMARRFLTEWNNFRLETAAVSDAKEP